MRHLIRHPIPFCIALTLCAGPWACAGEPQGEEAPGGSGSLSADAPEAGAMAATREAPDQASSAGLAGAGGGDEHAASEGGEHAGEEHAHGEEGGAESGMYVSASEVWDRTTDGVRLSLVYDPGYDTFQGRVYNETGAKLCGVRVEVHLSNGTQLGPTTPADVDAGAASLAELAVGGVSFERWAAHVETSACQG